MNSAYDLIAQQTFELFEAFIKVGFTEAQALELTKSQYAFAYVNYMGELDRRHYSKSDRAEMLRKYIASKKETNNEQD